MRLALVLAVPLVLANAGCFSSAGFCCGRLTDFDETTRSDRREVKKEIAEKEEEEREEAAEDLLDDAKEVRKRDFADYVAFLVKKLDLPAVYADVRAKPGYVRAWRLTTFDAWANETGGEVAVKLEEIPDWANVLDVAAKRKYGKALDRGDRDALSRDLWLAERITTRHFALGVAGVDLELRATPEGAAGQRAEGAGSTESVLGTFGHARTDVDGRATVKVDPIWIAARAPGAYEITATVSPGRVTAPRLEIDDAGHLFVQRGGGAQHVLAIDADSLFDWKGAALAPLLLDERFALRDICVKERLPLVAKGTHKLLVISDDPDAFVPVFRQAMTRTGLFPKHPLGVFLAGNPVRAPVDPAARATFVKATLASLARANVTLDRFFTQDAALADALGEAGIPVVRIPRPNDGGWCSLAP